jgi:hypothetical protein
LIKYQDAFSKSATYIGFTNLVQHKISTGTALPIRQPIRWLPFGKRERNSLNVDIVDVLGSQGAYQISERH